MADAVLERLETRYDPGTRRRALIWVPTIAFFAVAVLWCWLDGIRFDVRVLFGVVCIYALFGLVAEICYRTPRIASFAVCIEGLDQLWVAAAAFTLLQYPLVRLGMPLSDKSLIEIDHALGFDWVAHFRAVRSWPYLIEALATVYASYAWLTPFLAIVVGLYSPKRFQQCLLANVIGAALCAVCSTVFPAIGAAGTFLPENEWPDYVNAFLSARGADALTLRFNELAGIEQFPSFHATMAVFYAYAFLALPKWLTFPLLALEAAMLLSALSIGGHHLADVIAGVAIGTLAILASSFVIDGRTGE
jgi:membrane-associated phospholipid phosphatase